MPKPIFLLPLMLLLAACQVEADRNFSSIVGEKQIRGAASPFKNPVAMSGPSERDIESSLPDPGEVLRAIYKKAGDGSSSYDIGNQVQVSYWYGHAYQFEGRRYFTGFAYSTSAMPDSEPEISAPGDLVQISQATYAFSPEGAVTLWEFVDTERDIGQFGGREKGNAVEEGRPPVTYRTPGGDYLIAVPTWYLETGVRVKTSEIFLLNRAQKRWKYLGSITTGEDNSAGCAGGAPEDEGLPPCAVSVGKLGFYLRPGEAMPSIQVKREGKVVDSPDKTRDLGPLDSREYFYDQAASKYALVG